MRRLSTKKTYPACADGDDALEEHFKPVQPEVKQWNRTSATMVGLTISMGASGFLLTRQCDRAWASELVGNELMLNTTKAAQGASKASIDPVENYQVTAQSTLSNSLAKQPYLKASKVQKIIVVNRIIHKTKAGKAVEALWESHGVNPNSFKSLAAANQQLQMGELGKVTSDGNALLKAKQRVRINRSEDSLSQLRFEESNNLPAPATLSAEPYSDESAGFNPNKSEETPLPAVVLSSASLYHPVKAGDTLTEIAHHHGIALPKLVNANRLTDPDRLQINQRIAIPAIQSSSTSGQMVAVIKHPTDPETMASSVAVASRTASSNSTVPIISPLSAAAKNSSVSVPTLAMSSELLTGAESIPSNPGGPQQKSASVVPKPLAGTSPLRAASGISSRISDETVQLSRPTFNKDQLAHSTAAKPELQSEWYLQNLRTQIQRLREKYPVQQTGSQSVPSVNKTDTVAMPVLAPALDMATISSKPFYPQLRVNRPADELISREFSLAQAAEPLPPEIQKQPSTKDSSLVPATTARQPMTMVPMDSVDASESLQFTGRRQVLSELPPLGAVDVYLPKPFDASAPFKGYIWPAKGVVTSGYGWRWGRMHKGIDIAAPIGTRVVASAPGIVAKAGWNSGGYGKLVELRHPNGTLTRYAHNNRVLVQAGQLVEQGQQIAEMGSTGRSTGPHSHFELYVVGKGAVNPVAYLTKRSQG